MHWRRRLAEAPRTARGALAVVGGASYGLLLTSLPSTSVRAAAVWAIVMAVVAAALVVAEPWTRRREARRLGWLGDPALLLRVRADVAAGRAPTATPQERELARRDCRSRLERLSFARPAAVLLGVGVAVAVAAGLHQHDLGSSWVFLLVVAAPAQVSAWVTLPRCRRALAELGEDEQTWAQRPGGTALLGGGHPAPHP